MLEHLREHFEIKPKTYQRIPSHPEPAPRKHYKNRYDPGELASLQPQIIAGKPWENRLAKLAAEIRPLLIINPNLLSRRRSFKKINFDLL